jgi:hypothetical protein
MLSMRAFAWPILYDNVFFQREVLILVEATDNHGRERRCFSGINSKKLMVGGNMNGGMDNRLNLPLALVFSES